MEERAIFSFNLYVYDEEGFVVCKKFCGPQGAVGDKIRYKKSILGLEPNKTYTLKVAEY